MRTNIILRLALKNLWAHRLRTFITVTGVMIGIGSIIFLVSLGYGLEKLVTEQVANFNAFTVIDVPSPSNADSKIEQASVDKIASIGHVKYVSSVSNLAGRIRKQEGTSTAETVITAAKDDYWKLSDISTSSGTFPQKENEIAVNQSVLTLMGEKAENIIGKDVYLDIIITKDMETNATESLRVVEDVPLHVTGVLNDNKGSVVFISPDLLIKNGTTKYSALKIKADNKDNVDLIRKQVENIGFETEYVGDTVSQITQVFTLFRFILALFGLVALVVAALGAFNTLTISLLERIREVGLLKALGMRNRDVYRLFIFESLIIGFMGGMLGLVLGVLLGDLINHIVLAFSLKSGAEAITLFVTPITFSVSVAIFSMIVGFITGWYPSKRAVKINPLDALRYE